MSFKLYILRHAKSDWYAGINSDFDRPINKRGQRNAKRIGQWMNDHEHIPQQIISSPATRARQTTEIVCKQFSKRQPDRIHYDKDLYLAERETLLECIELYRHGLDSLMLVAHNPGLQHLFYYLTRKSRQKMPADQSVTTANLIIFNYPECGKDMNLDEGELLEFIKPKLLD